MKHRIVTFVLKVLLLAMPASLWANDIVVFGDSLSDIGNLASIQGPFPPPYYEGSRVSNGPVAVEVFAELQAQPLTHSFAGGNNFAVAGAWAGRDTPIDLTFQVGAYLLANGGNAIADGIHVVLIGGNDVRAARDERASVANAIIRNAVDNIDEQVRLLIAAGARAVMVVNVPDIGIIPETTARNDAIRGNRIKRRASRYSRRFNRRLERAVGQVERDTGVDIVLLDLHGIIGEILRDEDARGFDNTTDPCFDSEAFQFIPACDNGNAAGGFVFFDWIHPSERTHAIAGRIMHAYAPVVD